MKLTLIGNGIMAQSLAKGLVNNYEVEMIGRDISKLKQVKEKIPEITIKELDDQEDISNKNVIFCVKPYALQSVAARLTGKANTLYSILAGTKLESLKKQISSKYYVRTMPNVAASVSMSMTTITGDNEAKISAMEIFNAIGKTVWVNTEKQLDIATAIAGSGPAYLALVAEAITDGAVKAGLERHISTELVHGLFLGTSALLAKTHPAILKDSVMSPGGTTAAGVAALEEGNVRNSMIKAIQAAYNKADELGNK
ncbi:pyrroline-5-carboxylate reductase [Arcobacter sp. CECT 8985]|uniref:pyrroline-5-carboxylate reductase n=1 Tax=Arcobacter sp. CECT 8985 TaxID=1935424 RepID=UPI00100BA7D2|nr:pyrroline-5-carboxylate reductase [Arcobacter sp. CECT 8985]RXJ87216.1 pyrroline-5-carboxylate reductase [Arcobacter sp. CECT 8985]